MILMYFYYPVTLSKGFLKYLGKFLPCLHVMCSANAPFLLRLDKNLNNGQVSLLN